MNSYVDSRSIPTKSTAALPTMNRRTSSRVESLSVFSFKIIPDDPSPSAFRLMSRRIGDLLSGSCLIGQDGGFVADFFPDTVRFGGLLRCLFQQQHRTKGGRLFRFRETMEQSFSESRGRPKPPTRTTSPPVTLTGNRIALRNLENQRISPTSLNSNCNNRGKVDHAPATRSPRTGASAAPPPRRSRSAGHRPR